jgi:hypothetical protein
MHPGGVLSIHLLYVVLVDLPYRRVMMIGYPNKCLKIVDTGAQSHLGCDPSPGDYQTIVNSTASVQFCLR